MAKTLQEAGFKKIGATMPATLQLCGQENFDELSRFAKDHPSIEKKAAFYAFRQKQLQRLEEKCAKSKETLQQLRELQKEQKTRHDKAVEKLESGLRESLNINLDDWIVPNADLDTLLKELESYETKLSVTMANRNDSSQIELIEQVSNGQMLHGVNKLDGSKSRGILLKSHDSILLRSTEENPKTKIQTFTSKHDETTFTKKMNKFGAGIDVSVSVGLTVAVEFSVSANYEYEKEESHKSQKGSSYLSTFKRSIVPLATCSFDDEDFILSSNALSALKNIEELVLAKSPEIEVHIACQNFFDKFGCCANRGPYTLGGVYWWKSFSEGFNETEVNEIKKLHKAKLSKLGGISYISVGGRLEADISYGTGSNTGSKTNDEKTNVEIEYGQEGGPPELTSLPQWKDSLIASNSTWKIINQKMDLMYIWEILKLNHSQYFKNVLMLSQILSRSWEDMLHNQKLQQSLTQKQNEEAQTLLENVKLWNDSKDESKCMANLSKFAEVKHSLSKTNSSNIWYEFYLNQLPIQFYLRWVVEFARDEHCSNSTAIHGILQQILEYLELVQVHHFPDQKLICQWLYPVDQTVNLDIDATCTDLQSFLLFLQKVIECVHLKEESEMSQAQRSAVELVASAVERLQRDYLQEESIEMFLLTTLLLPLNYDCEQCHFRNELSMKNLEQLRNKLGEVLRATHEDKLHEQVYLFLQALSCEKDFESSVSIDDLNSHLKYLMDKIPNIEAPVQDALVKCQQQSGEFDFQKLKISLKKIQYSESQTQATLMTSNLDPVVDEYDEVRPKTPIKDVKLANSEYGKFLEHLNFSQYFPQKLTLQHALVLERHGLASKSYTEDPHELLPIMLEKIKMSNQNCRKVLLYGNELDTDDDNSDSDSDDSGNDSVDDDDGIDVHDSGNHTDDTDDDDNNANISDDTVQKVETITVLVHPMDSLLTLIHCSDNFLRQDLYVKLNASQLAVPFLLPDPVSGTITFPLWALRSIVRNWNYKTKVSSSMVPESTTVKSEWKTTSQKRRIVDIEAPIVSFIRFNQFDGNYSKSQILNKVIGDSKNRCFFNYECDGSSAKRKFVDGLVEATWYLPSGEISEDKLNNNSDHIHMHSDNDKDPFNTVVTFLNLRGNAGKHENQLEFLLAHTYLFFVFLATEDVKAYKDKLKKFKSANAKVIFLMKTCPRKKEEKLKKLVPRCSIISLSDVKESAAIVKSIRGTIFDQISSSGRSRPKKRLSEIQPCKFGVTIDELTVSSCKCAQELALEIMKTIEHIPMKEVKNKMVPLQGPNLWREWAVLNKRQNRKKPEDMGNMGMEEFDKLKSQAKTDIRRSQLKEATNLSPVMTQFIDVLKNESPEVRAYFLQWLKMYLDDRSHKELPELQEECKNLRNKLRKRNSVVASFEDQATIRKNLLEKTKVLIDASFGIEHLFRELGQIYECTIEVGNNDEKSKVAVFPTAAAWLLLKGHPLEVVDGDAAHIPLHWITAIINNLKHLIKNSKVFVLSVLGIQSTGKSTLMNTLFGARFAVSAGRCTRGAYFQLMKLDSIPPSTVAKLAKGDYVLIIDTEGLRAPELDPLHVGQHDNELATLVIGIADMTIININGEVAADIKDILETSVHAFVRMKQVDLRPSCQFVRHNVFEGGDTQQFQQTLDEMTVLAAKAEHCEGEYTQFSDVISFNNETDVGNFPNLWEGNPPMAPINPVYCDAAQNLKLKLIETISKSGAIFSVDDFKKRVSTLWEAVLKENYIFSFKNALEIEAYTAVDAEYSKWKWRLQILMLTWQHEAQNRIISSSDDTVDVNAKEQVESIIHFLDLEYDELTKHVEIFFEKSNSPLAPMMAQWRTRYEKKLCDIKNDKEQEALKFCEDIKEKRSAEKELDKLKKNVRKNINRHLEVLISETHVDKDKNLTEKELNELERKFNQKWDSWMTDIRNKHPLKETDLEFRIVQCVKTECQLELYDSLINSEIKKLPLKDRGQPLQLMIEQERHLNFSMIDDLIYSVDGRNKDVSKAQDKTKAIISEVKKYFSSDKSYKAYNDHIQHIVRLISSQIDKFDQYGGAHFTKWRGGNYHHFMFTKEYRIDLILAAAGYTLSVFTKQQNKEIENHPLTYLQTLKSSYSNSFKALCTATAHEKASALCLVDLVAKKLELSLQKKFVPLLADDVRSNNIVFASKLKLKGNILLRLLKRQHFHSYMLYIDDISQSYLEWIAEYIDEHSKHSRKLVKLAEPEVKNIITKTIRAADCAQAKSTGIKQWLTVFQSDLKEELLLDESELHDVLCLRKDSNLQFFTDEFIKGIKQYQTKYLADFEKLEESKVLDFAKLVNETAKILHDSVAGCCAQCPFCKEQCERTDSEHEDKHHCSLHRPQYLGGCSMDTSNTMVLDICTDLVNSDYKFKCPDTHDKWVRFKDYHTIYDCWNIPNESGKIAPYWKWFTVRYKEHITSMFCMDDSTEIPDDWKHLTEEDAEKDIKKRYQI